MIEEASSFEELLHSLSHIFSGEERDIQVLARALGLDPHEDFRELDLSGIELGGQDLTGFDFHGSNLSGADFRGTNIGVWQIMNCNLSGVMFDARFERELRNTDEIEKTGIEKFGNALRAVDGDFIVGDIAIGSRSVASQGASGSETPVGQTETAVRDLTRQEQPTKPARKGWWQRTFRSE